MPAPCNLAATVLSGIPLPASLAGSSLDPMLVAFLAQNPPASPGAGGGLIGLLPILFIFIIGYYVMIRPQMRRQKEQQRLVAALKTGDRVVTSAGIHGMITNVKDTTVIVKVADNVKLEMEKSAITNVFKPTGATA